MRPRKLVFLLPIAILAGCKSSFVAATLHNSCKQRVSLVEVDYPSASFGVQSLPPGGELHYRFKILGSGPLKISYTDESSHEHTSAGPVLSEGEEGNLRITISETHVDWKSDLHSR